MLHDVAIPTHIERHFLWSVIEGPYTNFDHLINASILWLARTNGLDIVSKLKAERQDKGDGSKTAMSIDLTVESEDIVDQYQAIDATITAQDVVIAGLTLLQRQELWLRERFAALKDPQ